MPEESGNALPTLALSTKLEEDFVSPLTALRGSLEILRDHPDLSVTDRQRFIETALHGCARLEQSIQDLGASVYAAGKQAEQQAESAAPGSGFAARINVLSDLDCIEVDFSEFSFTDSNVVNAFYDAIESVVEPTGRKWYFIVNFRNCSVWPEAWVAFAHRGKKVSVLHALGTFRYAENATGSGGSQDTDMFATRAAALAHINQLREQ